jgi:hypothetical protein
VKRKMHAYLQRSGEDARPDLIRLSIVLLPPNLPKPRQNLTRRIAETRVHYAGLV